MRLLVASLVLMKLLFLVNGSEQSADAARAVAFSRRLPGDWEIKVAYRGERKPKAILQFIRTAVAFRPDVLYVVKMAYSGVIAGVVAKYLLHSKLLCDTGDLAYELAKSTGGYSSSQLNLIRVIEQIGQRAADAVVTRGSYHASLLTRQGIQRAEFVPDGVDVESERPSRDMSVRTELQLGTDLVIGLVGSMEWSQRHQMCYGWDIVEAMPHLKDCPVKALLVGDGDGRAKLEARARELGVAKRVHFVGRKPMAELGRYFAAMDVCVSTQSADAVGEVRTTGKLPLYLAHGKYVIATNVGEARNALKSVGCLLPYSGVRDDTYPARLASHVRGLLSNRSALNVRDAARDIALKQFDYAILALRIQHICEAVDAGRSMPSSAFAPSAAGLVSSLKDEI
jgi:glycosyltransferase involved in cell wall biosynthesis